MPNRCAMPREKVPVRRRATPSRPTRPSTSSTREAGMPLPPRAPSDGRRLAPVRRSRLTRPYAEPVDQFAYCPLRGYGPRDAHYTVAGVASRPLRRRCPDPEQAAPAAVRPGAGRPDSRGTPAGAVSVVARTPQSTNRARSGSRTDHRGACRCRPSVPRTRKRTDGSTGVDSRSRAAAAKRAECFLLRQPKDLPWRTSAR
jgi:hypothetical protein